MWSWFCCPSLILVFECIHVWLGLFSFSKTHSNYMQKPIQSKLGLTSFQLSLWLHLWLIDCYCSGLCCFSILINHEMWRMVFDKFSLTLVGLGSWIFCCTAEKKQLFSILFSWSHRKKWIQKQSRFIKGARKGASDNWNHAFVGIRVLLLCYSKVAWCKSVRNC